MSNPTIESIMTTRAIRRFTDEPVSDEDLATCLRAAQQAPSGGNVQPQQYLVVTDAGPAGGGRPLVPGGVRPLRGVAARPDVVPLRRGRGVVAADP